MLGKVEEYFDLHASVYIDSIRNESEELMEMAQDQLLSENMKKIFGEVFTPMSLCNEMLDKLPGEVWSNPDLKWLDPACGSSNFLVAVRKRLMAGLKDAMPDVEERKAHIMNNMLYGVDIQPKNVILSLFRMDPEKKYNLHEHLVCENSLEFDYWGGMKFDVVVGNPPYQAPQNAKGKRGGGSQLWDRFVNMVLDRLLVASGYLCFIHPAIWRKPMADLWKRMSNLNIHYLEIHSATDGKKVFNAGTRYDWYVLQNTECQGNTKVIDENGVSYSINLTEWSWLPNFGFDIISNILATDDDETCGILFSRSAYGSDKDWVSKDEDEVFCRPCVHSTAKTKGGLVLHWSKKNDNGFFGIPKVIFGDGGSINSFVDTSGEYAMTQHAMAIADNVNCLDSISTALNSEEFDKVIKSCMWSNFQIDWRMFKYFRKDFWKEFVEEGDTNE